MDRYILCKEVAFVTFKEWGAYRTHSMVSIFAGLVYFIAQFFIWTVVYGGGGSLNGMELEQIIRYFGATALIGYLVMDFTDWNLAMLVRTGKFLTFTLRPLEHRFFAFSQKLGHRALGFITEFLPCLVIFVLIIGIDMRPERPFWLLISIILAFCMNFLVHYCIGLAAFWFVRAEAIRSAYMLFNSIFSGMLIPLVFFPAPLQTAQFFLPFQYTSYVPAMVFLGTYTMGGVELSIPAVVALQAVAVAVMYGLCELLCRAAMRRFTAVGT